MIHDDEITPLFAFHTMTDLGFASIFGSGGEGVVWDPFAGAGILRDSVMGFDRVRNVFASDIKPKTWGIFENDYYSLRSPFWRSAVVTHPPYSSQRKACEKISRHARYAVAVFLCIDGLTLADLRRAWFYILNRRNIDFQAFITYKHTMQLETDINNMDLETGKVRKGPHKYAWMVYSSRPHKKILTEIDNSPFLY